MAACERFSAWRSITHKLSASRMLSRMSISWTCAKDVTIFTPSYTFSLFLFAIKSSWFLRSCSQENATQLANTLQRAPWLITYFFVKGIIRSAWLVHFNDDHFLIIIFVNLYPFVFTKSKVFYIGFFGSFVRRCSHLWYYNSTFFGRGPFTIPHVSRFYVHVSNVMNYFLNDNLIVLMSQLRICLHMLYSFQAHILIRFLVVHSSFFQ